MAHSAYRHDRRATCRAAQGEGARERRKRRQDGGTPTREAYLAKFESKQRPWEAEGIHRRTWERRRARAAVASAHDKASAALGDATIVIKAEDTAAAASKVETQKGHQEKGEVKKFREAGKIREVESQTPSSSPELRQRERHPNAEVAIEHDLMRHPLYGALLDWCELESHLADAAAAEAVESGAGARLILARYQERAKA
jgi:hypothetical protein